MKPDHENIRTWLTAAVHVILPAGLIIVLFVIAVELLLIPMMRDFMLENRMHTLRALSSTVTELLEQYHQRVREGQLDLAEAQQRAASRISAMRYGPGNKDYFWINNTNLTMVMHPYREDLVGKDLSTYKDPKGKALFATMLKAVQSNQQGYVDYIWQWHDIPDRLEEKVSFVRIFEPWGWIVGTGVYMDDLEQDIQKLVWDFRMAVAWIFIIFLITSAYMVWHGSRHEISRIKTNRALERYTADLQHRNREIRRFAYIVSHDLRAPLINIAGFIQILHQAIDEVQAVLQAVMPKLNREQQTRVHAAMDEDMPEALNFIRASTERMNRQIEGILQLSRMERRELEPERINMNELVRENLSIFAHRIEEEQIELQIAPLPEVTADRRSMEQIMGNLIDNAFKYLDPKRRGCISIGGEQRDRDTLFYIRDNGMGIAQKDAPLIFEIFRRAGSQNVPGEGMGLSYTQALVHRHQGKIYCETELNKGSVFYFTIAHDITLSDQHS